MRAMASEWSRLRRPAVVAGSGLTIVGIAALVTVILFLVARPATEIAAEAAANAAAGTPGRSAGFPVERLTVGAGFTVPFSMAASLLGVVALVLFAQNLGSEYGQGTLKVLLSREPRRLRLLAGKLAALATFVILATVVAFVVAVLAASATAAARGIDTSAWWTSASLRDAGLLLVRVCTASLAWGALGTVLAVVLRAAPAAIGIGIGYTVVGEPILALAAKGAAKVLPGQVIQAFTGWGTTPNGTEALAGPQALLAMAGYTLVALGVAAVLFKRRDVTG